MKAFRDMTLDELLAEGGHGCDCGRRHGTRHLKIGQGVTKNLPEALRTLGKRKPFIVCDERTRAAA